MHNVLCCYKKEEDFIRRMEKKMFRSGVAGTIVSCILLVGMSLFFGIMIFGILRTALYGSPILDADSYGDFVYIDADYLSGSFGSDDDGNEYLFAMTADADGSYHDYIVSLPEAVYNSTEIQGKINQGDTDDAAPLRIKGTMEHTSSDLDELAQKTFAEYLSLDSAEEAADYLGSVCLVYSVSGNNLADLGIGMWIALVFMAGLIIVWIVEIIRLIRRQGKKNRKIANARMLYESNADYQNGVRQTTESDAQFFRNCRCYVTREYIVSYQDGLEVFRIDQIRELYGFDKQRYHAILSFLFGAFAGFSVEHYLVAITADGEVHQFARLNAALKSHNRIAAAILQKNQELLLGRMNTAVSAVGQSLEKLNLAKVKGFYGSNDIWTGRSLDSFRIE